MLEKVTDESKGKKALRRDFNGNLRLRVNNTGKSINWLELIIWMNIRGWFAVLPGTELS